MTGRAFPVRLDTYAYDEERGQYVTHEEQWKSVRGYEGVYEVSSLGGVRSLDRLSTSSEGISRSIRGVTLKPTSGRRGHLSVDLSLGGITVMTLVHRLVCEAFHGPAPEGKPMALHRNGDSQDNRAENLYWGDYSDNTRDAVGHGTHANSAKTHCSRGHEYTEENTRYSRGGRSRECRRCGVLRQQATRRARTGTLREGDERHGSIYAYKTFACRCALCVESHRAYQKDYRTRKGEVSEA